MSVFLCRSLCSPCLLLRPYNHISRLHRYSSSTSSALQVETTNNSRTHSTGRGTQVPTKPVKTNETSPYSRNILEQTKVQDYLDYVASTNNSVTLEDIERCKPLHHGAPGTPQYEVDYNSLLDTLVRSFSMKQLRKFLHLYGLQPPSRRTKWNYAASIIERQWNWPSLTEIQKKQRDWSEVIHRTFPLDPRQAFLLLGKDGADLLSLSIKYNVHVSFSANPLCLKVEGLRGSLDNLSQYIAQFKEGIKEETFTLPVGGRIAKPDLLRRISRLCGVLVENSENLVFRISYKSTEYRAAQIAKRLTTRIASECSSVPMFIYSSKNSSTEPSTTVLPKLFPYTYSLYPYIPSRSLPWTVNTGSLFRIRRVGEWLKINPREDVNEPGIVGGTATALTGERVDVKDMLLRGLPVPLQGSKSGRVITATFGHVLACTPPSQPTSITPPLTGHWELSEALNWIKNNDLERVFIPNLPGPLLDSPRSNKQRLIHRLVYQALQLGTKESGHDKSSSSSIQIFKSELHIKPPNLPSQLSDAATKDVSQSNEDILPTLPPAHQSVGNGTMTDNKPECWVGLDTKLDLMLPNCAMDIRFSIFDSMSVSPAILPQELQQYFNELQAFLCTSREESLQPHAPLTFVFRDTTYVLQSNSNVYQSFETVLNHSLNSDASTLPVVKESVLDLESNDRHTACQVTCEDFTSSEGWSLFLNTCDRLATTSRPIITDKPVISV